MGAKQRRRRRKKQVAHSVTAYIHINRIGASFAVYVSRCWCCCRCADARWLCCSSHCVLIFVVLQLCNIIKLLLFVRRRRTRPLLPICNETNLLFDHLKPSIRSLYNILMRMQCSMCANYSPTKQQYNTPQTCKLCLLDDTIWQSKCAIYGDLRIGFSSFFFEFFVFCRFHIIP